MIMTHKNDDKNAFGNEISIDMLRSVLRGTDPKSPDLSELPTGLEFPLRKLAPDAIEHIIPFRRFSVREMKKLAAEFLPFCEEDAKDPNRFYSVFFDLVERQPIMATALEDCALPEAKNRSEVKKMVTKLSKKPTLGFALSCNPRLWGIIGEVCASDATIPTELLVALFFDYAMIERTRSTISPEKLLHPLRPKQTQQPEIEDYDDENKCRHAIQEARDRLSKLRDDSPPKAFDDVISSISVARDAAERLREIASHEKPLMKLVEQIANRMEMPADEVLAWYQKYQKAANFINDILLKLDKLNIHSDNAEEACSKLKNEISKKITEEDFRKVENLSKIAQTLNTVVNDIKVHNEETINLIRTQLKSEPWISTLREKLSTLETAESRLQEKLEVLSADDLVDDTIFVHKESSEDTRETYLNEDGSKVSATCEQGSIASEIYELDDKRKHSKKPSVVSNTAIPRRKKDDKPRSENKILAERKNKEYPPQEKTAENKSPRLLEKPDTREIALFSELLLKDMPSVAARTSEAMEANNRVPPVISSVLDAASYARALGTDYTSDFDRLAAKASGARTGNEADGVVAFGALLVGALLVPQARLRRNLEQIHLGSFGMDLNALQKEIAKLDFAFPPDPDELSSLAGTQTKSRAERKLQDLQEWVEAARQRSGPCQPSTRFLHAVASNSGKIGTVFDKMRSEAPEARTLAKEVVNLFGSSSDLEAAIREEHRSRGFPRSPSINPKSLTYLRRQLGEPVRAIQGWLSARPRASGVGSHRGASVPSQVNEMKDRLQSAADKLAVRVENSKNSKRENAVLDAAVASWLQKRIEVAICGLNGDDSSQFTSIEEAETFDAARLFWPVRQAIGAGK